MRKHCALLFLLLLACIRAAPASSDFDLAAVSHLFPQQGLESRTAFWKMIYSEYDRRHVVLHDRWNLAIIYKVLEFDRIAEESESDAREQRNKIKEEVSRIQNALADFASLGIEAAGVSATHREVYEALRRAGVTMTPDFLRLAASQVRDQRGVKDKFEAGVIRSGLYLPYLQQILRDKALPEELAYLPHVESSFDYAAYSKAGAAGIWQFMRGTARGLLKMNAVLDERRDPLRSTAAAASVLATNLRLLGSWPLAITAYNHGANGMLRAKAAHGDDYLSILEKYDGKFFGFASRNFYSEFLAALEVAKNYRRYFPSAQMAEPLKFDQLVLRQGSRAEQLAAIGHVTAETLRAYNPGVLVDIRRNFHRLPTGYSVRVPEGGEHAVLTAGGTEKQDLRPRPTRTPRNQKDRPRYYKVRPGDTLTKIAALFGVSTKALQNRNKSLKSGQIFAGQVILLP